MSIRPPASQRKKPDTLGIVVAIAGIIASAVASLFLIPAFVLLPVVLIWAGVYSFVGGARQRWPWWMLGQWASFSVVLLVTFLADGLRGMALALAPAIAAVLTVVWMGVVGMVVGHKHGWNTPRQGVWADTEESTTAQGQSGGPL